MRSLARALLILPAFSLLCICARAQPAQKSGAGVITGSIMMGDKPAPGLVVIAAPGEFSPDGREAGRATTDYDGNYRLLGLPAGRYNITPLSLTMVSAEDNTYGGAGRFVILAEGETVEKIDFSLKRAGVITGRITDKDGKPVIEERVQLAAVDNSNRVGFGAFSSPLMYQTDDRGVYRLYGLPAGRYTLSVGLSPDDGMVRVGVVKRGYYPRTYYPGETDIKKAGVIEVTEGGEVRDINIKLGRQSQSFAVSGRVLNGETGRPAPDLIIGYGTYDPQRKSMNAYGFGQSRTDARGEFRLEGIVPGRFAAFVWSEGENYSDPALFEVTDADVGGLELKLKRGSTITGAAQLEGTADKSVMARLSKLMLGASVQTSNLGPPENRQATINPDGSFRMTGLPPGRASLFLFGNQPQREIRLLRVERDGVEQAGGIEIKPGVEIKDVRVIFEYGSGRILGQVRVENGGLPDVARLFISVHKPGDENNSQPVTYSQADARGRFILEGLVPGDYQVVVRAQLPLPTGSERLVTGRQSVTVSNAIETEVTVTLDLKEQEKER
jgi:hypothetical protein